MLDEGPATLKLVPDFVLHSSLNPICLHFKNILIQAWKSFGIQYSFQNQSELVDP